MSGKRSYNSNCGVAQALDQIGDGWSLRIVLEAMQGTRRFVDFQQRLGIARNILCDRLTRLVSHEILYKADVGKRGSRYEYRLTAKGRDLFAVILTLRQWSERWSADSEPVVLRDRATGRPVAPVRVYDADGQPLELRDVFLELSTNNDIDTEKLRANRA